MYDYETACIHWQTPRLLHLSPSGYCTANASPCVNPFLASPASHTIVHDAHVLIQLPDPCCWLVQAGVVLPFKLAQGLLTLLQTPPWHSPLAQCLKTLEHILVDQVSILAVIVMAMTASKLSRPCVLGAVMLPFLVPKLPTHCTVTLNDSLCGNEGRCIECMACRPLKHLARG